VTPRPRKPLQTVPIGKYCCAKGCNFVANWARRFSNGMWFTMCDAHRTQEFDVDIHKVADVPQPRSKRKAAA